MHYTYNPKHFCDLQAVGLDQSVAKATTSRAAFGVRIMPKFALRGQL